MGQGSRVPLGPGAHRAESEGDVGFGITPYGYASYTSYLYPGGMNLWTWIRSWNDVCPASLAGASFAG